MHIDQIYIQYLKDNNSSGIQLIYNKFSRQIVTLIQRNSGTEDDGYDIFQESLVDIYHMAREKDFVLTTNFGSFLQLVCKRKWLNHLKKNQKLQVTNVEDSVLDIRDSSDDDYDLFIQQIERENTVMDMLESLGDRCKEIIKRCLVEKNQEKIALSLGITYAYLRKKKSECMASLTKKVKDNGIK